MLEMLGTAGIEKNIKLIGVLGKKMDNLIHITACSCIHHVEKHGDVTLATKLATRMIESMPKSGRTKTLIAWMEEHGKVEWKKDKFVYAKEKETKLDKAIPLPFYLWKKEVVELKPFDLLKTIQNAVKKADKIKDSGNQEVIKGSNIPNKTLDQLRQLVGMA